MKYGYLRVSTNTQDETRQREALKKYGVLEENIYLDKASGKNFIDRTEWQKLLVKVIISILHLLGYFAEKERKKIKIRQKEAYDSLEKDSKGRKISRKKNKVLGRPNKIEKILQDNNEIIKLWIEKKLQLKKFWKY